MIDHVLHYADLGFSVIPMHYVRPDGRCSCLSSSCSSIGKHPRVRWREFTSKRLKAAELKRFWDEDPDCNIGIVTGEISGVAVLDVDGPEGVAALAEIGITLDDLPATPTVRTGGGGWHFYFRYPESQTVLTRAGVLNHVDIRSDGGVVVVPPSMHRSGTAYTWVEGKSLESLDPADFDFSRLTPPAPAASTQVDHDAWYNVAITGAGEGSRNELAARLAGRYFGMGMSAIEVLHLLRAWNINNTPPMEEKEVQKVVDSIRRAAEGGGPTADRDDLMEDLGRLIGLAVLDVRRVTGDTPKVLIEFDRGICTLTTGQLISPKEFQRVVCDATKVLIRKRGPKTSPTHERMAQMLLDAAEDWDAGVEATGIGELTLLIQDYLGSQRIALESDALPLQGPFWREERIWVSLIDIVQVANARWGARTSIREMAQRLRGAGVERKTFNMGAAQRNVWGIDPAQIDWVPVEAEKDDS